MGALWLNPSKTVGDLQINERFGALLFEERTTAGHSLARVAQTFGLRLCDLYDWERGLVSPPAKIFYAIVKYYGPAAFRRAAQLDMEVQIGKYHLLVASRNGVAPIHSSVTSQNFSLTA